MPRVTALMIINKVNASQTPPYPIMGFKSSAAEINITNDISMPFLISADRVAPIKIPSNMNDHIEIAGEIITQIK
jgi:hypothetical protein